MNHGNGDQDYYYQGYETDYNQYYDYDAEQNPHKIGQISKCKAIDEEGFKAVKSKKKIQYQKTSVFDDAIDKAKSSKRSHTQEAVVAGTAPCRATCPKGVNDSCGGDPKNSNGYHDKCNCSSESPPKQFDFGNRILAQNPKGSTRISTQLLDLHIHQK